MKNLSIIIPFKGSTATLPRLFSTIPEDDNIEIILIENSNTPRSREKIGIDRDYILLNAEENRYAGGARNVGIEAASGKWLIFADADDFFANDAFTVFNKYIDSAYDLVYFGCDSIYIPSFLPAKRHLRANNLVLNRDKKFFSENKIRVEHICPYSKMILHEFIINNSIKFDELLLSEDVIFSMKSGIYSEHIGCDPSIVYIITDHKDNITKRWDKMTLDARIKAIHERNKLLDDNNLKKYKTSIFLFYIMAIINNPLLIYEVFVSIIKYHTILIPELFNLFWVLYRKFNRN